MYLDKPLAGHNLMQAIARVNRVYGEKPGGLIVDLIGLADPLADALATYANATGESEGPIQELQDEEITPYLVFLQRIAAMIRKRLADDGALGRGTAGHPQRSLLNFESSQPLEQKNLALETLRKLLTDQIKISERTNLVQVQ